MCSCGTSYGNMTPEEKEEFKRQRRRTKLIDKDLAQDHAQRDQVIKLLFFGAGESGKSTLFKQMISLYGEGFDKEDRKEYRVIIAWNIIEAMQALIRASEEFSPIQSGKGKRSAEFVRNLQGDEMIDETIAKHIKRLWKNKDIRATYKLRNLFQLVDSAEYFFNKIDEIAEEDYIPTFQDVLRSRVRTSGIVDKMFTIEGVKFSMFDVGGQRNERKKWLHCFENVQAIIFVAALSVYDQVLYEDEEQNRMLEALELWEKICNAKWFKDTSMILFLNKRDLFEEKILESPITSCFPDYDGDGSYEDTVEFIKIKFGERNRNPNKQIYMHVTCATDTDNVQKVFNSTKDSIMRQHLSQRGFV